MVRISGIVSALYLLVLIFLFNCSIAKDSPRANDSSSVANGNSDLHRTASYKVLDPATILTNIDLDKGKEAVPELIKALEDEDPEVRSAAAVALGQIGPDAKTAVPNLIWALSDRETEVRMYAALGLRGIGPDAKDAVPELLRALNDDDLSIYIYAGYALGNIGINLQQAMTITHVLKDNDPSVRTAAARALKGIGPDATDVLPALIEALGDSDPIIRVFTCQAIAKLGSNAKDAIPKLRELAEGDPYLHPAGVYYIRHVAEETIAKIEGTWIENSESNEAGDQ